MSASRAAVPNLSRYYWLIFAIGFLAGLAVVLIGWRAQHFVATNQDPYAWEDMGRSVLHGRDFAGYGSVLNRRGPIYPFTIALLYRVFGERALVVQIAQCIMLGLICVIAFDLGRRMFNIRTGLIAGVACAIHPGFLRYVPDFHVETLLTLLVMVMVWRSVLFLENPSSPNGIWLGIAFGLASLCKPVVLLYPIVYVGWLMWLRRKDRSKTDDRRTAAAQWIPLALIFVGMGLVILPWTARNYHRTGKLVLITTGAGDAFLRGFVFSKWEYATLRLPPYTYAENESNALFKSLCAQQGTVWERDDIESDRILSRAAKAKLVSDPVGTVRKFVVGLFTFWYEMTSKANSAVMGMLALLGIALGFVGWRRAQREHRPVWPLAAPILYLNIMLALLLALGRYSVPVLPCLMILAAFGVDTLWRSRA
jgi:4-amino-4-deoxy-L-arabinose transferase-like glycosyltransferase